MIRVFAGLYERYFSEEEAIIFTLLLFIGAVVMLTMGAIIAPLIWSIVITFLLQGLVNTLVKLRMPTKAAVYLVYFVFTGLSLLVIFVFLPLTWRRLGLFINELPSMIGQLRSLFLLLPENYPDLFTEDQVQDWLNAMQGEVGLVGQAILSYSVSSIARMVTLLVYLVLVPITVFFMLNDLDKLLNWMENWLPKKRPIMAQIWHEMNDQLTNYIRGKAIEILVVGILAYVVFLLFGLNYPVLLSVLVGLSVIVPYVGAVAVSVLVFLVGFFQWGISPALYKMLIAYGILQLIDANILVPLILSEALNLHPVAIIAAVLIFGGLWGFWGIFFAIPLATFIKAIIRAWPSHHLVESASSKSLSEY